MSDFMMKIKPRSPVTVKGTKKPAGSGRQPGTTNKTTAEARAAIAAFVDNNSNRLQDWLDQVAEGVPRLDKNGNKAYNGDGEQVWLVAPNPEKAYNMFQSVIEYHVPKLARTEISGTPGGAPLLAASVDLKGLSNAELDQMSALMAKAAAKPG